MSRSPFKSYSKLKNRKILSISAGGEGGGIQCLYFIRNDKGWELLSKAGIPYPHAINALIESCNTGPVRTADLAWLDCRVSQLLVEGAKAVLAPVPRAFRSPHIIALNQLSVFQGLTGDKKPPQPWNILLGDPQLLAQSVSVPVISDFSRYHLLAGRTELSPFLSGDLVIARKLSGTVVFLNIGLISRMTILDPATGRCILDSDTGPGMGLINRTAREHNLPEGIDRDGANAAQGAVDVPVLESLATFPWFLTSSPRLAGMELFDPLLRKPELMMLQLNDKLATLTALTAKTIYDFFRAEYREPNGPEAVIVSGGGANNTALMKCLATYFGHLPVKTSEELGIPLEMRVPLAMGLSADQCLCGKSGSGEINRLGRVSMP